MKNIISNLRWTIADWLSYFAVKLRGQKWYLSENWSSVPGNRASELTQALWENTVILTLDDPDKRDEMDAQINELGQMAGANFGHVRLEEAKDQNK